MAQIPTVKEVLFNLLDELKQDSVIDYLKTNPEELEHYMQGIKNVVMFHVNEALSSAAKKAKIDYIEDGEITKVKSKKLDIDFLSETSAEVSFRINKQSILSAYPPENVN